MKPGPPPKDAARRQRRNTVVPFARVPDTPIETPPLPEGVDISLEGAWNTFWSSPPARLVREQDVPVVVRLFVYRTLHARCLADGADITTSGSQGQEVIHPSAKFLLSLEDKILRLETELGLTPLARAKLSIPEDPPEPAKVADERPKREDPRLAALE